MTPWRCLALLGLVRALTLAPPLRPCRTPLAARDDADEAPPEVTDDFRDFRARLIARTKGEGLTESGDENAIEAGWAYETPLLEAGCVLLGGTEQDFGFGLRQQYFHKCVLLLTQHDEGFTRGVIVNRPSRREVDGWTVWCGGDVEEGGIFAAQPGAGEQPPALECLSTMSIEGADSCTQINKNLFTTSFADACVAVEGNYDKTDFMCLCGYAGWAPAQLDGEVARASWHVASIDGGTLVKELLSNEDDPEYAVDDGLGIWAQLMRRIGKDPSPPGFEFDDGMLRAWIAARLDVKRLDASSFGEAAREKQREEVSMEAMSEDGVIQSGCVLACQALEPAADFLLERQFLHKALVQVIAVQEEVVVCCILNRPTSRKVSLKLGATERIKTIAFGGDVPVRSAQGGVVWLSRGPLPGGAGERLPCGDVSVKDKTHVVAASDIVEGLKSGDVEVQNVMAASGVVAFPLVELKRLLGSGHILPVPPERAPLGQCWALHDHTAAGNAEDAWRRAYVSALDAARERRAAALERGEAAAAVVAPAATPAELQGGLADEALVRFVDTFLT